MRELGTDQRVLALYPVMIATRLESSSFDLAVGPPNRNIPFSATFGKGEEQAWIVAGEIGTLYSMFSHPFPAPCADGDPCTDGISVRLFRRSFEA